MDCIIEELETRLEQCSICLKRFENLIAHQEKSGHVDLIDESSSSSSSSEENVESEDEGLNLVEGATSYKGVRRTSRGYEPQYFCSPDEKYWTYLHERTGKPLRGWHYVSHSFYEDVEEAAKVYVYLILMTRFKCCLLHFSSVLSIILAGHHHFS